MSARRGYVALLIAWVTCGAPLVASEQFSQTLPVGTNPADHGLTLTIESDWVHGPGYRPVRVVARPVKGPYAYDRSLRVEISLRNYSSGSYRTVENLELPAGSTSGEVLALVPNVENHSIWNINVYEHDAPLKELCAQNYSSRNSDDFLSALYIQPSSRLLVPPFGDCLPDNDPNNANGRPATTSDPAVWSPGTLPENWLGYTSLDLVAIAAADLKAMEQKEPVRFQALRRWTHSGGTLMVHSLGGAGASASNEKMRTGAEVKPLDDLTALDTERDSSLGLEERRFGLGRLLLVAAPLDKQMPASLQSSLKVILSHQGFLARDRFGIDVAASEMTYFSFLVPGVRLPPVGAFVLLITLFVVILGPVNYLILRMKKKLFLLPLTIAAGALVVTGGLVGYALFHDGLGVRVRTRSYTRLDQKAGLAASFSRQAYYAGLAPSGGLTFPNHAAVFPLQLADDEYRRRFEITWPAGEQQLRRGYFPSRTTAQMMVVSSAPSELALHVSPARENNVPPTVKNELGGAIVALSLCDEHGHYFAGENIADGELRELADADDQGIALAVSSAINSERLKPPPFELSTTVRYRRYRNYYPYSNNDEETDYAAKSAMEKRLYELGQTTCPLAPRSYVAVVEQSPSVPLGYEQAQEMGCFHVVEGSW